MAKKADTKEETIDVLEVAQGRINVCILGTTPIIMNRLSEKAKHELVLPGRKKNAVERQTTLKHDVWSEFRNSPYVLASDADPTYVAVLAAAFKQSMMAAALDLPGTKKAQIGRLTWVDGMYAPIYGVPQILLSTVRSADMNRTPDIRTRAVLPRWACRLSVTFVQPLMKAQTVLRLLAAAGLFIGVGDWRNQKGSGTFGAFKMVEPDDAEFLDVIATGGRAAQIEALQAPEPFDSESADLLTWFDAELSRRQMRGIS